MLDATDDLMYFVGYAIAFIIGIFVTRWIFGIDAIINNLKQQTVINKSLLINIRTLRKIVSNLAEKQGLTKEEIEVMALESVEDTNKGD